MLFSRVSQEFMGETLPPEDSPCNGLQCYQVFSCRGFSYVTAHIQQPLFTLMGCIIFPLGCNACIYGFRFELRLVALWLLLISAIYSATFVADIFYYEFCDAYPGQEIQKVFLWHVSLFLTPAQHEALEKMDFFPKDATDKVTDNFPTQQAYLGGNIIAILVMFYTAREARQLGVLFERGTLGMGIHYGFGAFTEIVRNPELQQRKAPSSRFTSDANPPLWKADVRTPLPYRISKEYGTNYKPKDSLKADEFTAQVHDELGTQDKLKILSGRHAHLEEKFTEVHQELQEAEISLQRAIEARDHQKEKESHLETEANVKFRTKEIKKEGHLEHLCEELAEEHAEEAAQEAEAEGADRMQVARKAAEAYRKELSKEHAMMLNIAKCRTIHEHYRHAEREHKYEEMAIEKIEEVEECEERVSRAREEVHKVEEYAAALGRREEVLLDQDIQERMEDEERMRKLAAKHAAMHQKDAMTAAMGAALHKEEKEEDTNPYAEDLEEGYYPEGQDFYPPDTQDFYQPMASMGPEGWNYVQSSPQIPGINPFASMGPVGTTYTLPPQTLPTQTLPPQTTAYTLPPQSVARTLPPMSTTSLQAGTLPPVMMPMGSAPPSVVSVGQSGNFRPTPVPSNFASNSNRLL
jgi:hypothetical protein